MIPCQTVARTTPDEMRMVVRCIYALEDVWPSDVPFIENLTMIRERLDRASRRSGTSGERKIKLPYVEAHAVQKTLLMVLSDPEIEFFHVKSFEEMGLLLNALCGLTGGRQGKRERKDDALLGADESTLYRRKVRRRYSVAHALRVEKEN